MHHLHQLHKTIDRKLIFFFCQYISMSKLLHIVNKNDENNLFNKKKNFGYLTTTSNIEKMHLLYIYVSINHVNVI